MWERNLCPWPYNYNTDIYQVSSRDQKITTTIHNPYNPHYTDVKTETREFKWLNQDNRARLWLSQALNTFFSNPTIYILSLLLCSQVNSPAYVGIRSQKSILETEKGMRILSFYQFRTCYIYIGSLGSLQTTKNKFELTIKENGGCC